MITYQPIEAMITQSGWYLHLVGWSAGGMGLLGLFLACLGIYGVPDDHRRTCTGQTTTTGEADIDVVATDDLPRTEHPFDTRLNHILEKHDFEYVEGLCERF